MLWWFLILGVSAAVVLSVAMILLMRVRRQMEHADPKRVEIEVLNSADPSRPPEA